MVDSIGSRLTREALTPVATAAKVQSPAGRPTDAAVSQREVSALAFDYDKAAAVNAAHVAEIRRAVRDGTYPILPETIADRLLALKLNWSPKK